MSFGIDCLVLAFKKTNPFCLHPPGIQTQNMLVVSRACYGLIGKVMIHCEHGQGFGPQPQPSHDYLLTPLNQFLSVSFNKALQ